MDISADQSKQVAEAEMADVDQFRPAAAPAVAPGSLQTTEDVREEMAGEAKDEEDISGADAQQAANGSNASAVEREVGTAATSPTLSAHTDMTVVGDAGTLPLAAPGEHQRTEAQAKDASDSADELTAKMTDAANDDLINEFETQVIGGDGPSQRMVQETSELEQNTSAPADSSNTNGQQPPTIQTHSNVGEEAASEKEDTSGDAEFEAAARAQAGNPEAEFAMDSSAESSSDTSSSDDSDDSDDEVTSMDVEELGRILMNEDGGDGNHGPGHQPRTQNETEMVFTTPDIVMTDDMAITSLGKIENIVENLAVIKGNDTAATEVMEVESVLCNDDRKVIGVIQNILGKVDEPRYIVAFTNEQDIQAFGLQVGSNVNYVNSHSKTVFTQGLRTKGTDASNIHDEEVAEDDMDFSDDEKEAEFKRKNKESKKAGRGALSRSAFDRGEHERFEQTGGRGGRGGRGDRGDRGGRGGRGGRGRGGPIYARGAPGNDAAHDQPSGHFPSTLDYDGDGDGDKPQVKNNDSDDDFYTPLKRPDNMAQLQQTGGRSRENMGEGGRGRGRGDGGRGRSDRPWQGRGGHNNQQQYSGASQTNTAPQPTYGAAPAPAQNAHPWSHGQAQQPYGQQPHGQQALPQQPYTQQAYPQQQAQQFPQANPYSQQQTFPQQTWGQQQPQQFPQAYPQAPQQVASQANAQGGALSEQAQWAAWQTYWATVPPPQQANQQYPQQAMMQHAQTQQQENPQYPQQAMQQSAQQPAQVQQQAYPQYPQQTMQQPAQVQQQQPNHQQWAEYLRNNPAAAAQLYQSIQNHPSQQQGQ